jgi:hypothetical protein
LDAFKKSSIATSLNLSPVRSADTLLFLIPPVDWP